MRVSETAAGYTTALAELAVRFGANVQPGQVVMLRSEPGKEYLARAVAAAAYESGAKFVDLTVFDVHLKRARAMHADPDTLSFVPPWYGASMQALGEVRGALIALTGPVSPEVMADVEPELAGRDMLPRIAESGDLIDSRTISWTVVPCPTADWAGLAFPELEPDAALAQLWEQIAHVCRLDEPDPVAAWNTRFACLSAVAEKLDALALDAVRFEGPGTDLEVGLLRGSRWLAAWFETVDGVQHCANIPTEEVFTTPDPERVNGVVRATKPLFTSGVTITGLEVTFEGGRATRIDAEDGAGTLRAIASRDGGGLRLGEVALVDREGRIGPLGTVFYDTLLDENAASHIALGRGYVSAVEGEEELAKINDSEIHIDFMIGSDEVAVTGVTAEGREVPLLRSGVWQL